MIWFTAAHEVTPLGDRTLARTAPTQVVEKTHQVQSIVVRRCGSTTPCIDVLLYQASILGAKPHSSLRAIMVVYI